MLAILSAEQMMRKLSNDVENAQNSKHFKCVLCHPAI